jgi:hypothetical protein
VLSIKIEKTLRCLHDLTLFPPNLLFNGALKIVSFNSSKTLECGHYFSFINLRVDVLNPFTAS